MKRYFTLVLLFLITVPELMSEGKPKFYMAYKIACNPEIALTVQDKMFMLENTIGVKLQKAFPCISLKTENSVHQRLDDMRKICLLNDLSSEEIQKAIAEIGEDVNCDYLVHIQMQVFSDNIALIKCAVMDMKEPKTLANAVARESIASLSSKTGEELAKKITDDLKEREICPYSGPVTIEVKTTVDETETYQTSAPCDEDDATVTATKKSNETKKWELNKHALRASVGTMEYDLYENYTTVTNYPCYKCENGDQGPAKITEIQEAESKVEGLSSESTWEGKQVEDARIKVTFLDDGTYTLLVKATSKEGTNKNSKEEKVEGFCESESEPKETKTNRMNIPIEVILGPYSGTINDKVLHQKETKDLSKGTEKTTYTVDFTLTRKD